MLPSKNYFPFPSLCHHGHVEGRALRRLVCPNTAISTTEIFLFFLPLLSHCLLFPYPLAFMVPVWILHSFSIQSFTHSRFSTFTGKSLAFRVYHHLDLSLLLTFPNMRLQAMGLVYVFICLFFFFFYYKSPPSSFSFLFLVILVHVLRVLCLF